MAGADESDPHGDFIRGEQGLSSVDNTWEASVTPPAYRAAGYQQDADTIEFAAAVKAFAACAGGFEGDTCQGDSGGPVFVANDQGKLYLAGVTSRSVDGTSKCGKGGIYVKLTSPEFQSWLKSKGVPADLRADCQSVDRRRDDWISQIPGTMRKTANPSQTLPITILWEGDWEGKCKKSLFYWVFLVSAVGLEPTTT
jgi:hypothetical protein